MYVYIYTYIGHAGACFIIFHIWCKATNSYNTNTTTRRTTTPTTWIYNVQPATRNLANVTMLKEQHCTCALLRTCLKLLATVTLVLFGWQIVTPTLWPTFIVLESNLAVCEEYYYANCGYTAFCYNAFALRYVLPQRYTKLEHVFYLLYIYKFFIFCNIYNFIKQNMLSFYKKLMRPIHDFLI